MTIDWHKATDAELLAACHTQEEPFAVFYRRHERLIAGWLMRRSGRADVVGDLIAEVFAAAYIAAPRFRPGPQPAQAWLLGIARNKLLDSLRRERVDASARQRLQIDAIRLSQESTIVLQELGELDPLQLLSELPTDQREAISARVIEDLDYDELAARLSISPQVARKRVSRGLSSLRRRLQHEGADR
ncbi:MAG TPA: sigma-70 family RNA polymerase sigma factor [Solirubrobacteraceae bacterium]|jgi:RNA polymerase sigma-70 factor (ECF subfamily)